MCGALAETNKLRIKARRHKIKRSTKQNATVLQLIS